MPKLVNSIGLICDAVGVLLIWKYGLPEAISRTGAVHLILEQTDDAEIVKAKKFDRWARVGIALLVLGFILQLVSNFIPSTSR
ncbi:MAG: hypothetical protein Q7W05_11530 [Deltaproteobacteria bacterium]|nr:hypothetical protein [Deltaproteobacteria bacterium]